jgi:septin family protein
MASETSRQIQGMILVMGVTGSGKSHFVNTLVGKNVVEEWRGIDSRKIMEPTSDCVNSNRDKELYNGSCKPE